MNSSTEHEVIRKERIVQDNVQGGPDLAAVLFVVKNGGKIRITLYEVEKEEINITQRIF